MTQYRILTNQEIEILEHQDCTAENWLEVQVSEGFRPDRINGVRFNGKIKLGDLSGTRTVHGKTRKCGIFNSSLSDVTVGNSVLITDVKNLSNYSIGEDVLIENAGEISVTEETTFGQGTEIEIVNEAGGRELPITDELTAQLAAMVVFFRHDRDLTAILKSMIIKRVSSVRSSTGTIGQGSEIHHVGAIYNTLIGPFTRISGTTMLKNGTISGNHFDPVTIGESVIASHFIVQSGSSLAAGAHLEKCFVGQGVKIDKHVSAENSAFFANTEVGLCECCSIFAGPYTVSHHKSTLLIASMFSFFNAGSGTNQSNHMYKLGPVHQGILERGCKTGSLSYLLWPSRVGPFSAIMGKHYSNFDTGNFPFSYITEEKGRSILYPAMNLFTVGTRRDSEKWPTRDRRKDPDLKDLINFTLFNPYTAGRMVRAVKILEELTESSQKNQETVAYKGISIPRLLLKTTRKYYEMALTVHAGNQMLNRFRLLDGKVTLERVRQVLEPSGTSGPGEWIDLAGMLLPRSEMERLIRELKASGSIPSVALFLKQLVLVHGQFDIYSWNWCVNWIAQVKGVEPAKMEGKMLAELIAEWRDQSLRLNKMIRSDAEKEFDATSRISYGVIDEEKIRDADFEAVRGSFAENKFIKGLLTEAENITQTASRYISLLENLK